MIISFSGDEGAGKTTIAQRVAKELNFPRYYMGQIFRDIAKKKGLTILEYVSKGNDDPSVDKEVDDYMLGLSQKQDNFVIEGRTAFHIIPRSLKIYLSVNESVGAGRILKQIQEEKDDSRNEIRKKYSTLEEVLEKIRKRRETDDFRYQKYYGIDIRDKNNYDIVVDTTNLNPDQVFEKVLGFIQSKINEKSS